MREGDGERSAGLTLNFLESEEVLSIHLVQPSDADESVYIRQYSKGQRRREKKDVLGVDVFDGSLQSWNNDVLQRVDSSVGHLDDLVEDNESSLHSHGRNEYSDSIE